MNTTSVCVLCGRGSPDASLLGGRNGYVCFGCLASIFSDVARTYGHSRGPENAKSAPDAGHRCLMCDQPAPAGKLVAFRRPYCFCGECLQLAFEVCVSEGPEPLAVVNF